MNESAGKDTAGTPNSLRTYVRGISYVDERLMMQDFKDSGSSTDDRPYYYVIDRMYNVRFLRDRAGAIVERYCYDAYGRPLIRECPARGDMNLDGTVNNGDIYRFSQSSQGNIWDPRADMNDDGESNGDDTPYFITAKTTWPTGPTVAQAFSDVGNPFMFQGRPHLALDTAEDATSATLLLNDHRARFNDPVIGKWLVRDPKHYRKALLRPHHSRVWSWSGSTLKLRRGRADRKNAYNLLSGNPRTFLDPMGLDITVTYCPKIGQIHEGGYYTVSCGHGKTKECQKCKICSKCGFLLNYATNCGCCGDPGGAPSPCAHTHPYPPREFLDQSGTLFPNACCLAFRHLGGPGDCAECCEALCDPLAGAVLDLIFPGLGGPACIDRCEGQIGGCVSG